MDQTEQIDRLRALWKQGRDRYRAFFYTLNEVKAEVGDDALPTWCRTNIGIGLSVLVKTTEILRGTDAAAAKESLMAAKRAEDQAKALARLAAKAPPKPQPVRRTLKGG